MTTIHRCDRCKTDGDTFTRHLDVDSVLTTMTDPREVDLCGHCWSKFLEWLRNNWPEVKA